MHDVTEIAGLDFAFFYNWFEPYAVYELMKFMKVNIQIFTRRAGFNEGERAVHDKASKIAGLVPCKYVQIKSSVFLQVKLWNERFMYSTFCELRSKQWTRGFPQRVPDKAKVSLKLLAWFPANICMRIK